MKKLFAIVLAALMLLSCLTACGASGKTLEDVKKAGKLTIATSPDFPPFESLGENGEVFGIEIDILNLICAELGWSWRSTRWTLSPSCPVFRPASTMLVFPASP